MPFIVLSIITALFGTATVLDKFEDVQKDSTQTIINLAGLGLLAVGGFIVWKELKKKK